MAGGIKCVCQPCIEMVNSNRMTCPKRYKGPVASQLLYRTLIDVRICLYDEGNGDYGGGQQWHGTTVVVNDRGRCGKVEGSSDNLDSSGQNNDINFKETT